MAEVVIRVLPLLKLFKVRGHVDPKVFDARNGFLPGQRVLAVVDLGLVLGAEVAARRPNLKVLSLV